MGLLTFRLGDGGAGSLSGSKLTDRARTCEPLACFAALDEGLARLKQIVRSREAQPFFLRNDVHVVIAFLVDENPPTVERRLHASQLFHRSPIVTGITLATIGSGVCPAPSPHSPTTSRFAGGMGQSPKL